MWCLRSPTPFPPRTPAVLLSQPSNLRAPLPARQASIRQTLACRPSRSRARAKEAPFPPKSAPPLLAALVCCPCVCAALAFSSLANVRVYHRVRKLCLARVLDPWPRGNPELTVLLDVNHHFVTSTTTCAIITEPGCILDAYDYPPLYDSSGSTQPCDPGDTIPLGTNCTIQARTISSSFPPCALPDCYWSVLRLGCLLLTEHNRLALQSHMIRHPHTFVQYPAGSQIVPNYRYPYTHTQHIQCCNFLG